MKNLKKKQKELSRKHSGGSTDRDQAAEQIKDDTEEEEEEEEDSDLASIGKNHALKIYDQFAVNTSCFWGNTGSNITSVVQFHELFVTKILNLFILFWNKNFVKSVFKNS